VPELAERELQAARRARKHLAEKCRCLQSMSFVRGGELTDGAVKHLAGKCLSL